MIDDPKPYPAIKDSGVPWLGNVPEHWHVRKLRHILRRVTERSRPDLPLLSVVREKGVIRRDTTNAEENRNFIPDDLSNYKVVRVGQFAMNKMKAWQGSYGVSQFDGIVSPAYFVFHVTGVEGLFFHSAIRSRAYIPSFTQASDGVRIGQWDLAEARMREIAFFVPPLAEQNAIVRFLDYTNRRIDHYIRAKKKLIALLNEQKQAIIHRAVTRGLDPNVRLKPSGIPWLGDIPEHWEVMRLKSLVTEAVAGPYGSSLTKAMYSQRGYRVYGQQQVIPDDFSVGDYYISADKFVEMTRYRVLPHDVLVSVMGTVGRVAVVPETAEPGIINPRLVRYRPDFNRVRPRYLQLAMQASPSQAQLAEGAKGTTMEGLNMQILGKLLILVPPLHEQDAICNFLDSEVVTFDIAITRTEREIALIREYWRRLVSDVVTGQLDVREAAAKLPEESREEDVELIEEASGEESESSEFEDMSDSGTIA